MATYYSNKVQLNSAGSNMVTPKWLEDGDITVIANFTVGGIQLLANDTIQLMDIPAGVQITGFQIDSDDIDGGATLVFKVGDVNNTARFATGVTVGQAGGYAYQTVSGLLGYSYAAATRIFLTVTTQAASAAAAGNGIRVVVNYNADP